MELLTLAAIMVAAALIAGIISGLLGVGGGIILVPVFFYAFQSAGYAPDQLMQICVATSTGTIIFTSLRSVLSHARRGAVQVDLIKGWGPFIALGAILGVFAAASLRSTQLQFVFGTIGIGLGLYMGFGRKDWKISDTLPKPPLSWSFGGAIGFFSALMGIGGGSFTVPLLTAYGLSPHRAVGTSPGFGLMISIPAFVAFLLTGWDVTGKPPMTVGYVNLPTVGLVVLASMMTVPLGVSMAHRLSPGRLRLIFACTIFLLAGNMLRKAIIG